MSRKPTEATIAKYVDAVALFREFFAVASRTECIEPGCTRAPYARSYCEMHHKRLERRGLHAPQKTLNRLGESHVFIANALSSGTDECLVWPFASTQCEYGVFRFKDVNYRVNRFICTATHGAPSLVEMHAAHECGNSLCANPRHISWKTPVDNVADKKVHGTQMMGSSHHQAKLTAKDVVAIRSLRGIRTRKQIASQYGVGRSTIDNIIDRTTWRHIP